MIYQEQDRVKLVKTGEIGTVIGTAHSIGLMYVVEIDDTKKHYIVKDRDLEKVKENNNG